MNGHDHLVADGIRDQCTLWGLRANDLHNARWRSRGVQTVHRSQVFEKIPGVELFLLLEPSQMALFELSELAEAMVWNRAIVTRVRVVETGHEAFREQVILDDAGAIQHIKRLYIRDSHTRFRVLLTRSPAVASAWAGSATRPRWLDRIARNCWPTHSIRECAWTLLRCKQRRR